MSAITLAGAAAVLDHANVRAMLRVIREAESSQDDERAYRLRWGGEMFPAPPWRHPGTNTTARDKQGRLIQSSAAGAYQFLASTWADVAQLLGLPDFSPVNQDLGAVALIARAGALDAVLAGDLDAAMPKLARTWAGLPGDVYGQGGISMERARAAFEKWGGTAGEPAAAPIVESQPEIVIPPPGATPGPTEQQQPAEGDTMTPAIIAAIGESLLKALPWWSSGSTVATRNTDTVKAVAPVLIEAAKQASAQPGVLEAAQAVASNSAVRDRYVALIAPKWADIEPQLKFEEESRAKAREYAKEMTTTGPAWRQVGFGALIAVLALTIIGGGGVMFYQFMHTEGVSAEQKAMILGALLTAFGAVVQYFFGSSSSSRQKDQALADAARRT